MQPLCGIGGVDWDVMQVSATPTVVVDRTLPPDTGLPPDARERYSIRGKGPRPVLTQYW